MTPLHFAANAGHTDIVKALIAAKAEVNATDEHKSTPFHWACANKHLDVINILITFKANVDAADQVIF